MEEGMGHEWVFQYYNFVTKYWDLFKFDIWFWLSDLPVLQFELWLCLGYKLHSLLCLFNYKSCFTNISISLQGKLSYVAHDDLVLPADAKLAKMGPASMVQWLGIDPRTKRSQVGYLVKAHAWFASWIPTGYAWGSLLMMFLSNLCFSLSIPLPFFLLKNH